MSAGGGGGGRFENPKVAKAVPPVVNFGDTLNFGEPLADSFAKDFTLELDRVKVRLNRQSGLVHKAPQA